MAKLSADGTYVTLEWGDTLSAVARDYCNGTTWQQLAAINNIPNPDCIFVNQKIYLKDPKSSSSTPSTPSTSSSSSSSSNSTTATVDHFGYQTNSSGTLFAAWSWGNSNTDHYEVEWTYHTGDAIWFIGNKSTTEDKQSTYSIPENAKQVRFRVKPVSKTYTSNDKETSYWTASWSTVKTYNVSSNPPSIPPVPTVTIDKYKLTASIDNLDVNATKIEFKIVKDNSKTFKTGSATITERHASYSCNVDVGGEYKVACRSCRDKEYSEWSNYSDNITTAPATPSGITTCRATSETSVYLAWAAVATADSYTVEYTTKKEYFDGSDQITSIPDIKSTTYEKTGLESGQEYFFRVKAVNEKGESSWSEIKSVLIGKKPAAPTTWSSTTTAIVGEDVTLYWVHNSEDGSSQKYAELELTINGVLISPNTTIKNSTSEELKDKTSFCVIDTQNSYLRWTEDGADRSSYLGVDFREGCTIQWRVRTAGVTNEYGDWSVQRTIDNYAPATLELNVIDSKGNEIETLESFPCYISALAGPSTQFPLSYHVSIVANEVYETVDRMGNEITVNKGQEVYSKHFDITDSLMLELSAGNIDLENNIGYTVTCVVAMDSGLTAESSVNLNVAWTDVAYTPNAEISLDKETYVTHIRPFCKSYRLVVYKVELSNNKYVVTDEIIGGVYGEEVKRRFTTTGEQVYQGITSEGEETYYCYVEESNMIEGVTLSVYRREFDGGFTKLATGLVNGEDTFITDPHPALDYARYRIVAITDATGAVSYCDLAGYPVGCNAVIIQWDEVWSSFDVTSEDALIEPAWSGSMLKLPYNIDVSENSAPDVEMVEYIGREHPVSYYGTQRGSTATWNVDIEKDDEETLYALRRLQNWMGNAYVREPSGSGYWANVTVSFSQKHRDLVIPVTLNIKRVEGGV